MKGLNARDSPKKKCSKKRLRASILRERSDDEDLKIIPSTSLQLFFVRKGNVDDSLAGN